MEAFNPPEAAKYEYKEGLPACIIVDIDGTLAHMVNRGPFECVACGYENNADVVGAINVLERGQRLLACGELAQSGRSMKQEPAEAS